MQDKARYEAENIPEHQNNYSITKNWRESAYCSESRSFGVVQRHLFNVKTEPLFGGSMDPSIESLKQLHRVDFALHGKQNLSRILEYWQSVTRGRLDNGQDSLVQRSKNAEAPGFLQKEPEKIEKQSLVLKLDLDEREDVYEGKRQAK